jgi:hypothetical protein
MATMKIDWRQKLSSRKFWAATTAWATSVLTAFHAGDATIAQAAIIISGTGALVAYILAEGKVDAAGAQQTGDKEKEGFDLWKK